MKVGVINVSEDGLEISKHARGERTIVHDVGIRGLISVLLKDLKNLPCLFTKSG